MSAVISRTAACRLRLFMIERQRQGWESRRRPSTRHFTMPLDNAQVSTMYTQLNQYHVVMEVEPRFWQSPDGLKEIYLHPATGDRAAKRHRALRAGYSAPGGKSSGPVSVGNDLL